MSARLAFIAVASLGAACASAPRSALAPVTVLRTENLRLAVEPEPGGLPPTDAIAPWHDPDAGGPLITMTLRLYAVEPAILDEALSAHGGSLFAVACSRADARRLQHDLEQRSEPSVATLQGPARLTQHSGEKSCISVSKQIAYVAGFQLDATPQGAMADPRIEVASEGVLFTADARFDEASGAISIELELTVCQLDHPLAEQRIMLIADALPVTIQLPSGLTRRLTAQTALGPDEAFLFGGAALPAGDDGRALIAFLEADPAPSDPR
jgi:hypothetical protein